MEEGFLVTTDFQTHGKGQRGAKWSSEQAKNLMFTILLKPSFLTAIDLFRLNIAVSLSIYDTLAALNVPALSVKWPNDIFVGNNKIGGVLIENVLTGNKIGSALIGIGLNVNQREFDIPSATSLCVVLDQKELDRGFLLEKFCENLENRYLKLPFEEWTNLKNQFEANLFRREEWHSFRKDNEEFRGRIKGITKFGQLLIETEFGLNQFENKEFEYLI